LLSSLAYQATVEYRESGATHVRYGPKADMSLCATHVRFGGKADIVRHRVNQFGRMIQQMAARERRGEDSSAFESIMSKGDAMIKESGLAVGD